MANIPSNASGVVTTTSITGSFGGFTVISGSATFTALKDITGNNLTEISVDGDLPMYVTWTNIPVGTTIPIMVTSASLSSGAVLFYL